jgi:uncharacterized protein
MTMVLAGLLLGLAGSGHCVAMCGPLVLSIGSGLAPPGRSRPPLKTPLLYHAGRISTYVLLALPAGLLGQLLSLRGLGRAAAVGGAAVLLGMALNARRLPGVRRLYGFSASVAARACASAARWGRGRPTLGVFALGAANGLMPCGMVYAAVAAAAASGSLTEAFVMMVGFGLGTTPALLAVSISATSLPPHARAWLHRMAPLVLVLAAVLLLARAFELPPHAGVSHTSHHQAEARR